MNRIEAKAGQWYRDLGTGQNFEVVMIYPKCGTIEVEYADGTLVEYAVENWEALNLVHASGPDDTGPLDLVAEAASQEDAPVTPHTRYTEAVEQPQRTGPQPGCWYRDLDTDRAFEVVKIYAACGSVEVEFSDGGMEEYAIEAWQRLRLMPCEDPEIAEAALEEDRPAEVQPDQIAELNPQDPLAMPQAQPSLANLLGTTTIH